MIELALTILGLSFLIYLPTLNATPTWDCKPYFIDPDLKTWDWKWIRSWYNRALANATFRATIVFVPGPYHIQTLHVTQMVLHALCSFTVYFLAPDPMQGTVAALLFTVSPLATSAVCPAIATRSTLMSTLFGFSAIAVTMAGYPLLSIPLMVLACHAREDGFVFFVVVLWYSPLWFHIFSVIAGISFLLLIRKEFVHQVRHKLTHNGDEGMAQAGFETSYPQWVYNKTAIKENLLHWIPWNFGLLMNVDPVVERAGWKGLCAGLAIGAFLIWLLPTPLAILLFVSPWVFTWIFPLPDVLAENRAYCTIAVFALFLSSLPLPTWAVAALIALFAVTATFRAYQRRHPIPYWLSAWRPKKPKLRVAVNIAGAYQELQPCDFQNAMQWHQQALTITSTSGVVLANIGLWHEGMARTARAEFLGELTQTGAVHPEKAKTGSQLATFHLRKALELMSLGLYYCPEDPSVRMCTERVREHAKLSGIQ